MVLLLFGLWVPLERFHWDSAFADLYAFLSQALRLFFEFFGTDWKCDLAVAADNAVPGNRMTVW